MDNLDWNQLKAFLQTAQTGTLSAAARKLGLTQPTLSRQVAAIEQQMGVTLFERVGKAMVLTPTGLDLLEHARAMGAAAEALGLAASGRSQAVGGVVSVSASDAVAACLLPPIVQRLRTQEPGIAVEVIASNALSDLLRREADIALRMVRPNQASLVAKRIGAITLTACAHRDYLRRKGTPRQPPDLLQHELVGNDRHEDIQQGFAAMGYPVERQHFAFRTDDLMAYWEAVRAGLGIGFVGNYLARTDPNVVAVLPQLPLPDLPIWLTVHREIRTSRKIRAVYDFLASEVPLVL